MEQQLNAVESVLVDFMQKTKSRLEVIEKLLENQEPSVELIDAEYNKPDFPKIFYNCEMDINAIVKLENIMVEEIENNPDFAKNQILEYEEAEAKLFENYEENLINAICQRSQIYLQPDDRLQELIRECDERALTEREI